MTIQQDYIVGYGSLLSHDSRLRFSDLDISPIHVTVAGWHRSWSVRCEFELQTYVGVQQDDNSKLNAVLIPTDEITPALIEREKNYQFVQLCPSALSSANNGAKIPENAKFWICQPKHRRPADRDYPVNQSYVDTCLIGCIESGDDQLALEFIRSTSGWRHRWHNDRHDSKYPRAARITDAQIKRIDALIARSGMLHHRRDKS